MTSACLDRRTGRLITGSACIRQSVQDILETRLGARVLARDYGSDVPSWIDAPNTASNRLQLFVAIYNALRPRQGMFGQLGEPRLKLSRIDVVGMNLSGGLDLLIVGIEIPNGHKGDPTPANDGRPVTLAVSLSRIAS